MMPTLIPVASNSGVVPNQLGRVLSHEGASTSAEHAADVRGLYVVGWLKRGPTGIIGTNLIDAEETVG
jgi:adrenodoxin-NADP+ reductase